LKRKNKTRRKLSAKVKQREAAAKKKANIALAKKLINMVLNSENISERNKGIFAAKMMGFF